MSEYALRDLASLTSSGIFLPLKLIVGLGLMRPFKGLRIASQCRNKAAQIIDPD